MEKWMILAILVPVVIVGLAVVNHFENGKRRLARNSLAEKMASRTPLTAKELAQVAGEVVAPEITERVLRIVANVCDYSLGSTNVGVDPQRLRGDDLLVPDLGYQLDELSDCELAAQLEKEFGIQLETKDFDKPPTVRDVVKVVARKVSTSTAER